MIFGEKLMLYFLNNFAMFLRHIIIKVDFNDVKQGKHIFINGIYYENIKFFFIFVQEVPLNKF